MERFLYIKQVLLTALFLPAVVMKDHMGALAAEHPDIVGMIITSVAVDMIHHLTRQERTTELPLGNRPVFVAARTGAGIGTLLVTRGRVQGSDGKAHYSSLEGMP